VRTTPHVRYSTPRRVGAHAQLVGSRAIVGVEEDALRHAVAECHRLVPPAQAYHVTGVQLASAAGLRLTRGDRDELGLPQGIEYAIL
jgi:hypothetical protein